MANVGGDGLVATTSIKAWGPDKLGYILASDVLWEASLQSATWKGGCIRTRAEGLVTMPQSAGPIKNLEVASDDLAAQGNCGSQRKTPTEHRSRGEEGRTRFPVQKSTMYCITVRFW